MNKTFEEIMSMITSACRSDFYNGARGVEDMVIECATRIYIAQMNNKESEVQGE